MIFAVTVTDHIENYRIKMTQDHLMMTNFSRINKSTSGLIHLYFKRHPFAFLKILDRNALLGKCTAAIFSVIVDYLPDPSSSIFFSTITARFSNSICLTSHSPSSLCIDCAILSLLRCLSLISSLT